MLAQLVEKALTVDLFFFDGRIKPQDVAHILRLSHPRTIYVFDDYKDTMKGTTNVQLLKPFLRSHVLVPPLARNLFQTTLAVLLPEGT